MKGSIIARCENALGRVDPATIGPGLALLVMIVVFSTLSPYFLTRTNVTNVLVQSAPLLILATGQTFALLMGGLDLSQGSIVSLVSVVTAGVMMRYHIALGAAAGLCVGFGIALANGLLIGRARNPAVHRDARYALHGCGPRHGLFRRLVHFRSAETRR